jgi:hypothetical protein
MLGAGGHEGNLGVVGYDMRRASRKASPGMKAGYESYSSNLPVRVRLGDTMWPADISKSRSQPANMRKPSFEGGASYATDAIVGSLRSRVRGFSRNPPVAAASLQTAG